ncbi:MFS transporter [Rhizobium sp. LCM 4573]|uniref:MFS transporter n=1 Tax=Rhizobium sp. LCM 4573 TaxID=1848291 RepID=UPI0008DA996D|nr:MFS transporter [Rhizobium sp. LCM 4573]OHV75837.1 transporter [Rhizobium sp. LCM 4573]
MSRAISRKTVLCLALGQLVAWGISYYLIGVFGDLIAADLGWSAEIVHGGFAVALLVMGVVSPFVGRLIDRQGGRSVMIAGGLLNTAGCLLLTVSYSIPTYYAAWICIGLAMRLTLYDAAFAALVRIGGPEARRPISQITLLGGLASTTFWPIGHFLAEQFGWRGAVLAYAGFALLTIPLYLSIPKGQEKLTERPGAVEKAPPIAATGRRKQIILGSLYALIMSLANFLNAGMSAHMIGVLAGLGLAASASVWIATLRGIGQSLARFCEVLFGGRIDPLTLNLAATLILPLAFVVGLFSGVSAIAAGVFAFAYGAGNGLLTITRGTLPLVLFDHRSYGALVGRLAAPSFFFSAAAPIAYAYVMERFGEAGALYLSGGVATIIVFAAALLLLLGKRKPE